MNSNTPSIDFSRALRPPFTELIWEELRKGSSVNVHSPKKGVGKTRLLEDLRNALKEYVPVALIGVKQFRDNFSGFLEGICTQWDVAQKEKEPTDKDIKDFLDKDENKTKTFFLLLDDFETLLENSKDTTSFLTFLNSLKNYSNIGFCAVSPKPVNTRLFGS
ncbi:AAA family ATPase [Rhodoflexus caldus]|uniref:AAA family ATPase n=1 Tax=Rhodoflexus caldus TaxID=2891236 RepID=UPI002029CC9B|nr:AAA family ATPase [Rhodoflexus caldus]